MRLSTHTSSPQVTDDIKNNRVLAFSLKSLKRVSISVRSYSNENGGSTLHMIHEVYSLHVAVS